MTRWLIWSAFVIVWTIALEVPVKETEQLPGGEFIVSNKKLLAKSVHVVFYAILTVMSVWVPHNQRYRWLMMFFLMAHAWGTEMLQELLQPICFRGGTLSDVGFDVLGILLGFAASWKWWMNEPSEFPRK